jgi:S1-C subfamily serine protease
MVDGSTIYNKIKNSVVMISVDNKWQGTGFFVNNEGYICTAAHVISTTVDPEKETGALIPASNVFVLVSPSYHVYKCRVVGFDGAGDIGVIKIDENDPYNKNLPKIENNEYLKFSDNVKTGNLAFVLGYPLGTDISSFSMGIIRNENFVAPSLFLPFNLVLVTTPAYQGNSGSAIVNSNGEVVGLLTFVYFSKEQTYESIGGGPSKDIVSFVVDSIIKGDKGNDPHFDKRTKKFKKGFLGVGASKIVWFSDLPVISNKYKFPEIRPIGFRGQIEKNGKSDFSKLIKPTDIITKINGTNIGALPDQKAPGTVLWKLLPGDTVTIDYYTIENNKYILKKDVQLKLQSFPDELDTFEGRSLKVEINCSDDDCSLASGFTELPEPSKPIGF